MPSSSSSSSSATDIRDVSSSSTSTSSQPEKLTKIPLWLPISAFIGTSLALAIPLFMLRRRGVSKRSLNTSAPPPRRAQPGATVPQSSSSSSAASSSEPIVKSLRAEIETPTVGEMMSALSKMNSSSALMAAKAFGIATALVLAGGAGLVWGLKTTLDVHDARDFGQKMRFMMWRTMPDLTARILRPLESSEHTHSDTLAHSVLYAVEGIPTESTSISAPRMSEEAVEWSWEASQRRLQRAYDEGGFTLWARVALREMELEARVEREKREREFARTRERVG